MKTTKEPSAVEHKDREPDNKQAKEHRSSLLALMSFDKFTLTYTCWLKYLYFTLPRLLRASVTRLHRASVK